MKIALLSPVAWRTPPKNYGPWEQVVSNIAEGLVMAGFDVTLFATADSITKAKLDAVCDLPYAENPEIDAKVNECLHISNLMEKADQFDLIHNNFDYLPLTYSRLIKTPMVTTIHGFSSPKILAVYKKYNTDNTYVSISNANRHNELSYAATVYNGLDTRQFSFCPIPDDYLLFFGRIHPEKGTAGAIEIARLAGKKLIIAGLIQDQGYYDRAVKPYINNTNVCYVGNANAMERDGLLGKATALLHPINFAEPFGLSVAEAMLCGTPVIAFNLGSMPELIEDGKTGFLVKNIEEAVMAVKKIPEISRADCRSLAIIKFSVETMTKGYLQVYKKLLESRQK